MLCIEAIGLVHNRSTAMQSSISTVSPLRQRMVEDMRMRKLAPKTQYAYILAVRKFTKFLGHSPVKAICRVTRTAWP